MDHDKLLPGQCLILHPVAKVVALNRPIIRSLCYPLARSDAAELMAISRISANMRTPLTLSRRMSFYMRERSSGKGFGPWAYSFCERSRYLYARLRSVYVCYRWAKRMSCGIQRQVDAPSRIRLDGHRLQLVHVSSWQTGTCSTLLSAG
jgi:hypothetical protein